jgi:hypothetical protein
MRDGQQKTCYLVRHLYSWANDKQEHARFMLHSGQAYRDSILHKSAAGANGIELWRKLLDLSKTEVTNKTIKKELTDFDTKLSTIARTDHHSTNQPYVHKIGVSSLRRTKETAFLILHNKQPGVLSLHALSHYDHGLHRITS